MNDQQMYRLIGRLEVAATPNPEWVNTSLAQLLPTVRQARQRDASRLGQAALALAELRRLLRGSSSRKTLMSIAVALLLTTSIGIYLLATSNREPPGGPTGLLVVVQNGGLEAIDIRDSSTTQLLPPGSHVSAVSRSVDGRMVAFRVSVAFRGGEASGEVQPDVGDHYEVMGIDGTGRHWVATQLTFLGAPCRDAWSPDSRFLVAQLDVVDGGKGRIVIIDIASGAPRFVTQESTQASCPVWSPDGAWIAYTTSDRLLQRVRVDGTGTNTLETDADVATSWSDDGWIYWYSLSGGGVNRTHVDTGETRTVSDSRFGIGYAPSLSPDGTQLAVIYAMEGKPSYDLYLSAPDGSDARRVVSDIVMFDGWSADGQYLLVVWSPPLAAGETGGLMAIKPDGTGRRLVRQFDASCQRSYGSRCFRDIGWGQSRP